MTILVTGGAGFIGSNLCERLVQEGHEVHSLDNYSMGSKDNHVPGVHYHEGCTTEIWHAHLPKLDMIYHLGEYSRVEQSFEDIHNVLTYNTKGTMQVLEYCRRHGIRIVYAGSSTKFSNLGMNSTPYTWTKAINTQLVKNYGDWYGLDYAITYFYNVYGKREIRTGKYATLIALFCEKYKNGEDLTVVSPGTQLRNFTHIDDIVDGLVLIGNEAHGDEFGLGSDESFSVLDVAEMLDKDKIVMLPERRGNRSNGTVVTTKTKALGWSAKKSLPEYIKEFKENL